MLLPAICKMSAVFSNEIKAQYFLTHRCPFSIKTKNTITLIVPRNYNTRPSKTA